MMILSKSMEKGSILFSSTYHQDVANLEEVADLKKSNKQILDPEHIQQG